MIVTVVGAGIGGLATAWALSGRGHEVTLLEQAPVIPNPYAASGDQHRIIRRAYGSADGYARTIPEAFAAWDDMWGDLGRSHLANCGVLGVSLEKGDEGEQFRDGLDRMSAPYMLHEPAEAATRWPFLDAASLRYAYFSADGGALFPARIAADLLRLLAERGVAIQANARVSAVEADAGVVILDDGTRIAADQIVVTAGAWVLRLFPELGDALKTYRTAVVYLDPPRDLHEAWQRAPAMVSVGGDRHGYILPPVDGTELKLGAGIHRRPREPDEEREPHPGEGEQIRDYFAPPLVRLNEYRVKRTATCAYTFTEDGAFFARRIGKALAVSACSGHGYKFGAAVGRRVATALESGDDAGLFRWLRAE
ncbi:NAD(P)/FAD-dependent oxidoreductase [Bosea sp. 2KB_26]|uniref:NAD(P)/FAD-dependent oxidoreductase n=1 Tax=Bosea sp. 2KB_26 TaxID=3237475 RepID=UPI003F91F206